MSTQASGAPAVFELRAGSHAGRELDVVEVRGREGISRPWAFEILAVTRAPIAEVAAALLGQPARLVLHAGSDGPRQFAGIVSAVAPGSHRDAAGGVSLTVRLVPRFWLLGRRRTSRIFQEHTVPQIVAAVLAGLDVPCAFRLRSPSPPKEYCVQYEETDREFLSRLLAEEGIFYFFEPAPEGADSDVVVFADDDRGEPLARPRLLARPADGLRALDDFVEGFSVRREIRPQAVLLKDFDPHNPRFDLTASAEAPGVDRDQPVLRVYDHDGHYQAPEVSAERARVLLEQLRRRAVVARGASRAPRLAAGRRIHVAEHPLDGHDGDYLITRVDHVGRVPERLAGAASGSDEVYRNTFACVPADVVPRPRRPRRVPRQVLETAVVVGPVGEEIHTDASGRVRVQFHWDLDGRGAAHSSCWVPVAQAWAGSGFGFQFVPRVGMEVLVSFLGGDPDKPVVTGCLMGPLSPSTHPLPAQATRSGVRTRTTPGGDGHNELSFEDRRGQEALHLHAQRDMEVVVRRDQTTVVGRLDGAAPGGDQRTTVAGDQHVTTGGSRALRVGGDLDERVEGSRSEHVAHHLARRVVGSIEERCDGALTQAIAHGHEHRVDGSLRTQVGQDASLRVGGDREEVVGGSATLTVQGDLARAVQGAYAVSAAGGLVLTAGEPLRLVCGDAWIELGPREITLSAPAVTVLSTERATLSAPRASVQVENRRAEIRADDLRLHGKGAELHLGGDALRGAAKAGVHLAAKGASVVLDGDAAMDGGTVKLNCAGEDGGDFAEPDETEVSFVDVSLTHKVPRPGDPTQLHDVPVPGARFVVEASDGRRFRGVLDAQGRARVPVPPGPAHVSFPEYDTGRVKPA